MNLLHRFRKAADAIADFTRSEEQRYQKAARLWWLWRHEYLAAKQIDPQGNDLQARAHLAAFGEDAHTLEIFDRFYRVCLVNAKAIAPHDKDRTRIEPDLIRDLVDDADHGYFPVDATTTYQIDPPSDDPRTAAQQFAMPEKRKYGLAAAVLLAGLLAIWLVLPDSAPVVSVQADMLPAARPTPTPEPTPAPVEDAPPSWGSMAHGAVGNDPYERAPASLELGSAVYCVYAAEVYPGEPWQAEAQPGVAFWLPDSYANIVLCIPDQSVIEGVSTGDTITIRTGRSDVLRFTAKPAERFKPHETEVFDQRRAGITILLCQPDGSDRPVVRGTY